ncbi:MAG: DNA polymerase III subunit delta, partial [Phycisphaerales bacterium]
MARAATRTAGGRSELDASMRIVVLHGRELFLLWEWSRMLTERLREAHGDVGVVRFDGSNAPVADVLDELRSFGLLEPHKLVIVDDAERFLAVESKRRSLEQYAASPEEQATLLLRAGTWRPGNFDKLVAKVGTIMKCEPVSEEKAIAWCIARASKRHEADLDREAASLLVERIGSDLGRLDGEIGKLAVSPAAAEAGQRPRIDRGLVAAMVGASREE